MNADSDANCDSWGSAIALTGLCQGELKMFSFIFLLEGHKELKLDKFYQF